MNEQINAMYMSSIWCVIICILLLFSKTTSFWPTIFVLEKKYQYYTCGVTVTSVAMSTYRHYYISICREILCRSVLHVRDALHQLQYTVVSVLWTSMGRNNLLNRFFIIKVITKLPNSEQSYKGKVKTHNYINRQNQSTTGKLWKP